MNANFSLPYLLILGEVIALAWLISFRVRYGKGFFGRMTSRQRTLFRWVRLAVMFVPMATAAVDTFQAAFPIQSKVVIVVFYLLVFGWFLYSDPFRENA